MIIAISDKMPAGNIIAVADVAIVDNGETAEVVKDRHGKFFGQSVPSGKLGSFIFNSFSEQ